MLPMNVTESTANIADTFKAIDEYLTPTLLAKIRAYLSLAVRIDCNIPEDIQKVCWDLKLFSINICSIVTMYAGTSPIID